MKCAYCDEEHDEIYVHGRCHPESPTWAILTDHDISIICAECDAPIVKLELA